MFSVAPVAPRLWWHDIYEEIDFLGNIKNNTLLRLLVMELRGRFDII